MLLAEKLLRAQLNIFKPFISGSSLEFVRQSQDKIGELMAASRHRDVTVEEDERENYSAAWIYPKDRLQNGVILYLHGGGYTCGTLDYAKGFGSVLCAECGIAVYCVGYRLAPENPFPAALDDAIDSYFRLISCGYSPEHIVICGESSGGGLAFSLCSKLKELGEKLPAGIIAISPWTDLTASGDSYEYNKEKDPSLDKKRLDYYADCYAKDRNDPYVSPIFADVSGFPPTLIFVGEDEILLDDSKAMYRKLLDCGVKSELVIAPELWHVYVLYGLKSRKNDMEKINAFLKNTMHSERKLRWMGLDNAGKIYPAARRRTWTNMYRVSATLCDKIDPDVLQSALDVTVRRFPSIAVRVRTGAFWYYLEEVAKAPKVEPDNCYPLTHFPFSYISRCAIRVLYYENRLAVELFHGLTDGSGAMVFLKALTAEYITQKYGENIPYEKGVLSRLDIPHEDELEDSFPKYSGDVAKSRSEKDAYHLPGTPEKDGFLHVTTLMTSASALKAKAKEYGVTVNTLFVAAFMLAILKIQDREEIPVHRRKPVKILVPVNLRKIFPSNTLRNFAMFVTPEIDPRFGEYSFDELCTLVHHQMGCLVTKKEMAARIAPNMAAEQKKILRIMPLFIKNIAMKAVYDAVAERKSCVCVSNLGVVDIPDEMKKYVTRMDFILGVQATSPYNCGILTYGDTTYINFIRNVKEPHLEYAFFEVMRDLGIKIKAESNERN